MRPDVTGDDVQGMRNLVALERADVHIEDLEQLAEALGWAPPVQIDQWDLAIEEVAALVDELRELRRQIGNRPGAPRD